MKFLGLRKKHHDSSSARATEKLREIENRGPDATPPTNSGTTSIAFSSPNSTINNDGTFNSVVGSQYNTSHTTINNDTQKRFDTLKPVVDAAYNSFARRTATGCLGNTRAHLLNEIHQWVQTEGTMLYWLNGLAGTGKSTIAHSVAQYYDDPERGSLGASFFFSRDQKSRREAEYLFQTIAFQLGNKNKLLRTAIANALEDQTIMSSDWTVQLRKLILEPLFAVKSSLASHYLLVMDALDECEEADSVSRIITLFVQELEGKALPLKVFVTSRPESHIRNLFLSHKVEVHTRPFALHLISRSEVQNDIRLFIQIELDNIADTHREVLEGDRWPKTEDIEALVEMSGVLFIVAATALKFIRPDRPSSDPRDRMAIILNDEGLRSPISEDNPFHSLNTLYFQILAHAARGDQLPDAFSKLQIILGAIILAFGRLTRQELGELLGLNKAIFPILAELHSVLLVPKGNEPVQAFHPSFHDFLTDSSRCTDIRFFVDPPLHHTYLARFCLERMLRQSHGLKRDMCDIADVSKRNDEVHDLANKKVQYFTGDLLYACRCWAWHLRKCSEIDTLVDLCHSFTATAILYWIEALSLIGELSGGIYSVQAAQAKLSVLSVSQPELLELLNDTEVLLSQFHQPIAVSALQVYHLALRFTAKHTRLYQTHSHELDWKVFRLEERNASIFSERPILSSFPSIPIESAKPSIPDTPFRVCMFSLESLSLACDKIEFPNLRTTIKSLLKTMKNVQGGLEDVQTFQELAALVMHAESLVIRIRDVDNSILFLQNLEREFETLKAKIQQAASQDRLLLFILGTDDNSLTSHLTALAHVIKPAGAGNRQFVATSILPATTRTTNVEGHNLELQREVVVTEEMQRRFDLLNHLKTDYALPNQERIIEQIQVLDEIYSWFSSNTGHLFWLSGVAGSGKSTIANTVAQHFSEIGSLGAALCCSFRPHGGQELIKILQAIAFQLGSVYPILKSEIAKSVPEHGRLSSNLFDQFCSLILDPISAIQDSISSPILIIIEGLEQCDDSDIASSLIAIITELSKRHLPLKVFITSRPIALLHSISHAEHRGITLHHLEPNVHGNITQFMHYELEKLRQTRHLPEDMLSAERIAHLLALSQGLFLVATAVIKFLNISCHPVEVHIDELLEITPGLHTLDSLYSLILLHGAPRPQERENILRLIIVLTLEFAPMSLSEISWLLQEPSHIFEPALIRLHPILIFSGANNAKQIAHSSFQDYITDILRCPPEFYVDLMVQHAELAGYCIRAMRHSLGRNICHIANPYKSNIETDDLASRVAQYVPAGLQYACRYWAWHLRDCSIDNKLLQDLHEFAFTVILYWIELLSIMGELPDAKYSLQAAIAAISATDNPSQPLLEMLKDAEKLISDFLQPISASALQVYFSALRFSPRDSLLYRTYSNLHS